MYKCDLSVCFHMKVLNISELLTNKSYKTLKLIVKCNKIKVYNQMLN
jgi:hypothetical protein